METIWPLPTERFTGRALIDRTVLQLKVMPGFCNICGKLTVFSTRHENFREHVACYQCRSANRQRQMAAVLLAYSLNNGKNTPLLASISDLPSSIVIWNAETTRALHAKLKNHLGVNYVSTEYIDSKFQSGDTVGGALHVDIQNTHFQGNSFDYILTSDVMEHVPFPEKALKETYRVLKPGGCHIFTAPFYHHRFTNEQRASIGTDGTIEHNMQPWYHLDPLRPEGVLAYNVFGPELLCQIEAIGFEAKLLRLHSPFHGIYGQNGIVIVAKKAVPPNHARDWIFT